MGQRNILDGYGDFNAANGIDGHLQGLGDDPVGSIAGFGADAIGLVQGYGAPVAEALGFVKQAKFIEAAETPIIEAGLMALATMGNLCGFGTPDEGQGFGLGSDAYQKIEQTLSTTDAPGTWTGDGSVSYTGQNDAQQSRAAKMATTDRKIQHVLEREAQQLDQTRKVIDYMSTTLTAAIIPAVTALSIEIPPGAGVALSMEIQTIAVLGTVPMATTAFELMAAQALANANEIQTLSKTYDGIGGESLPSVPCTNDELAVVTSELQGLATDQDEVSSDATTAAQTTSSAVRNVLASHGMVCAPTSAAVATAVADRTQASGLIHAESSGLAHKLRRAAGDYDGTDDAQRERINCEVPPF
jgi:ESX secretion-associated protein EspA/E